MQLDKLKVSAPEILRMIPDEELAKLANAGGDVSKFSDRYRIRTRIP